MVFWPCEGGPWPRAVQDVKVGRQSQGLELEKARFEAGFYAIQKVTFGSLGYGPQARSVLHCHGVLALRGGPWPRAVQDESWQAKSRLGARKSKV